MQGFGNEDAESFVGIVAEPAALKTVWQAEIQATPGTFGDDGDIGMKVVEMVSFAGQRHFAIPDYDSHGQFSSRKSCDAVRLDSNAEVVERTERGTAERQIPRDDNSLLGIKTDEDS